MNLRPIRDQVTDGGNTIHYGIVLRVVVWIIDTLDRYRERRVDRLWAPYENAMHDEVSDLR